MPNSSHIHDSFLVDQSLLSPQHREDVRAVYKGTTNTIRAVPIGKKDLPVNARLMK